MNWYHKLPSVEVLEELYVDKQLSLRQVADLYGANHRSVQGKLRRGGVRMRTREEAWAIRANYLALSSESMMFLEGLLLGDGCLAIERNSSGKSVAYKHTDKHKSYILWLRGQLERFGFKCGNIYQHKTTGCYHITTSYYRGELLVLYNKWYPGGKKNGKKKIPADIELSPNTLKHWYIGDGNYKPGINGTRRNRSVTLAIKSDKDGRKLLTNKLNGLNIDASAHRDSIYITAQGRPMFFKYMLSLDSYIPECYKYKFPTE
jgi:hypothetical protein